MYMYYMYYMIDKRESKLHVQRVGVRGTNFALSNPGVWEAKRTCMQAGLQRPAEAAAPSQLKMAEEQQPSPFTVQLPYDPAPSLLPLYFTSTIFNSCWHSHYHCKSASASALPRSRRDAAPSANHLCMASSKGKEAFRSPRRTPDVSPEVV